MSVTGLDSNCRADERKWRQVTPESGDWDRCESQRASDVERQEMEKRKEG